MPKTTESQAKLLAALKDLERRTQSFTVDDLAEATGYKSTALHTYIGKKLLGRYVFSVDDDGRYESKNISTVSDADFAAQMSQKDSLDKFEEHLKHLTKDEWERAVEILIADGQKRNYNTTDVLTRLLEQV